MKERVIPMQQQGTADTDPAVDPEVARLRRRLERERAARLAAEAIGERATAELLATVADLRATQERVRTAAERARKVSQLGRELRQDTDRDRVLARAAAALGEDAGVDRAQVHVLLPEAGGEAIGDWVRPGADLPPAVPLASLPESFFELAGELALRRQGLFVDDVLDDDRFTPEDARAIVAAVGMRSGLGVPICLAEQAVGWLLLMSVEPHPWEEGDLAAYQDIADDLATTLIQLQSHRAQRESTLRLQQLDEEKNAFIANVSHELRTPLTSINGYLELLTEGGMGELTEEQRRGVSIVARNAERLRSLVEDLLSLASYDAREVGLVVDAVNLEDLVNDCLTDLAPTLATRRLDIRVESPGKPLIVLGDRTQLVRVAANLIGNAVKFTPDGGRVTIRLEQRATTVRMTVSDTGIGIPASEQDRVFARFFRSSLSVAGEIQGTGLGLALSRTIVRQHGGRMALRSTEGVGTEVEMELRAAPPALVQRD